MRFQDKGVEDFVREADAVGVNSFELAEQQACTSEDPDHPGLTCNLVEHGPKGHYALGYRWDDEDGLPVAHVHEGSDYECHLSHKAELNAFADAVEDYVRAFETEEESSRLRHEAQELLARMGVTA